jgi:hypothetical protein
VDVGGDVQRGTGTGSRSPQVLLALAADELGRTGLVDFTRVEHGYVVLVPEQVGGDGLHCYSDLDHSMPTAIRAVANLLGAVNDVWSVNADS